jgi:hypothetical protein
VTANFEWVKLYEAAVLETNPNILPSRIEDAKDAIGRRVQSMKPRDVRLLKR